MRIITAEEIEKIRQANESMKGTDKYNKYHMCHSSKRTIDDKWGKWTYLGWDIPYRSIPYFIKTIKDTTYIMSEKYNDFGESCIERYEVTDSVKELLNL